jgi:hypothetical protein
MRWLVVGDDKAHCVPKNKGATMATSGSLAQRTDRNIVSVGRSRMKYLETTDETGMFDCIRKRPIA